MRASSSFIQVNGVHNSLTEVRRDAHLSLNAKGVFTLLLLSSLANVAIHSDVSVLTSMGAQDTVEIFKAWMLVLGHIYLPTS